MLTYDLSGRGRAPLYEYLSDCLRRDILSGRLAVGGRLPSRRALAEHLGVSLITVDAAYGLLLDEGCVEARPRRGYYVASPALRGPDGQARAEAPREPEVPRLLRLAGSRMDAGLFPAALWARLTRRVLSEDPDALLRSAPHEGLTELREAIAAYLRGSKGLDVRAGQVIIGAGAEFLYLLTAQFFAGASIAVEDPGYPKIRQVYAAAGAVCIPLPLDGRGLSLSALERSGAAVAHISPAHQFPTGILTPMPRRLALLDWARSTGGYIIEDDYDGEFGARQRPLPTLAGIDRAGRVIYMSTFSQTVSPALRIGFLVLPERLCGLWRERLGFYSCAVPSLEQQVLARFISGGYYERHLNRLRKAAREKRAALSAAIEASPLAPIAALPEPGAGVHLLLRMDTPLSDAEARRRGEEHGLALSFLSDYAASPGHAAQHTLVINCAALPASRLDEAVSGLAKVFA